MYHARVKITNGQGTVYSPDFEFSTLPPGAAPTFSGETATQFITVSSARLQSPTLVPGDAETTLLFEYGLTDEYGNSSSQTVSSGTIATVRSANISGLLPGREYHFRVTATSVYGTAVSQDSVFTTSHFPALTTIPATTVTDVSAVLRGEVDPNGTSSAVRFDWGETSAYGNQVVPSGQYISGADPVPFSLLLEGLKPNTTYHYRIAFGIYTGEDHTFTTGAPASLPTVSADLIISGISQNSANLRIPEVRAGGSDADISFEYGTSTSYGQETSILPPVAAGGKLLNVSASLSDLVADTVYHVRSKVTNSQGTVYGNNHVFSTSLRVVTGIASEISPFSAIFNGAANPGGGTLNLSFRWGTSSGSLWNIVPASPATASGPRYLFRHLCARVPPAGLDLLLSALGN